MENNVNTLINSMRASSPPPRSDQSSNQNPSSVLILFDHVKHTSNGKQIILFLDYDGTLSPIVPDPDKAFMSQNMRATLKDLTMHFPTAIVSGRCIDKLQNFVNLEELYYAGSHGMDIKGPIKEGNYDVVLFQPASEFLPMIKEVYKIMVEKTKSVPGATVEDNKFCLSVHYRRVDEKHWEALGDLVRLELKEYPKLKLTRGRKVLEIKPDIKWDKGMAVNFLLESLGYGDSSNVFPIYIGDDRTDEDAFEVLRTRGQGIGILVSKIPKETNASYTLQDPLEVGKFLRHLVDWKSCS